MAELPAVEIVEVSPRDGLQNEKKLLPTEDKVELIRRAAELGVRRVEITSFVRPDRVPQLADAAEVAAAVREADIVTSALALNLRGYERSVEAGIGDVNTVVLATESFSQRNQGMSVAQAIAGVAKMREQAKRDGVALTVTLSAAFGCPFEGEVSEQALREILAKLVDLEPDEIALADTIGVAVPAEMERRFGILRELAPSLPMRVHLHDTRNTAVANAVAAVRSGVTVLDASLGGIGGCPFAPAATGNVATEDLIYLFDRMGYRTGLELDQAIDHARWLTDALGVAITGRVASAGGFAAGGPDE
ncbi:MULTISPECIES: hydroxymethylglutaryl-CoA lyase [unclassified Nocardioides]|uniref:hydroxymethylglutaryl-CoA lyase n=1 Tax=unclassified Nocardioides TaxID=2615069 RepID=UPI00360A5547